MTPIGSILLLMDKYIIHWITGFWNGLQFKTRNYIRALGYEGTIGINMMDHDGKCVISLSMKNNTHRNSWQFGIKLLLRQFWWIHLSCSISRLFLADMSGSWCSPSASRFNVLYIQRCSSGCNKWLWELLLSSYQHKDVWPFSFDLWHLLGLFFPEYCHSWDIFSFSNPSTINSRDGCVGKSQKISGLLNIQISPFDTNNHAVFKVTHFCSPSCRVNINLV